MCAPDDHKAAFDDAKVPIILKELNVSDPDKVLTTIERESQWMFKNAEQAPSSFLFKDPLYVEWSTVPSSKILWISGDQFRGKTTFAASLIRELQKKCQNDDDSNNMLLSYTFCNDDVCSSVGLLKALLHQLVFNRRELAAHLQLRDDNRRKDQKSASLVVEDTAVLWQSLRKMCNASSSECAYFIIDSFDRIDDDSRKEVFEGLRELMNSPTSQRDKRFSPIEVEMTQGCQLKWLFLGRSRDDIDDFFGKYLSINMEDEPHHFLVEQAVDDKFATAADQIGQRLNYPGALTYLIKTYFKSKSERDEVWIKLASEELENRNLPHRHIRQFLEDLPSGNGMFDYISNRVLNNRIEGVGLRKEIFRALMLAFEPPNLRELAILVGDPNVEEAIGACSPFIEVASGCVDFAHTKIRDLFENESNAIHKVLFPAESGIRLQHGLMALRCFEYATVWRAQPMNEPMEDQEKGQDQDQVENINDDQSAVNNPEAAASEVEETPAGVNQVPDEELRQDVSFLPTSQTETLSDDYVTKYWLLHARRSTPDLVQTLNLRNQFWERDSQLRRSWWQQYRDLDPEQIEEDLEDLDFMPALHLACFFGYSALVDGLLESGHQDEIKTYDSYGLTPLYWASYQGSVDIVQKLLKAGANIEEGRHGVKNSVSALWGAAFTGKLDTIKLLVSKAARIDVPDERSGTALYVAAEMGHLDVVKFLLAHSADPNIELGVYKTPLAAAAYGRFDEAVDVLLKAGAHKDPDGLNFRYGTPLGAACRMGSLSIVKKLVEAGCDVNKQFSSSNYRCATSCAASYGHGDIVQFLLEKGVDEQSQEQALQAAARLGEEEMVKILLAASPSLSRNQAFLKAAAHGQDEVIELLSHDSLDRDILDSALYQASDGEHEDTLSLLLNLGASPDAEGAEYGNALIAAAYDGSQGIVQILLDHGAEVNFHGGDYGDAVQAAAISGASGIIDILLERGALVNADKPLGKFGSALQAAAFAGNQSIVQTLLEHKADVNSRDKTGGSPLLAAAEKGEADIVELLIGAGADVTIRGGLLENTPLIFTAGNLAVRYSKLLLDKGASVLETNKNGKTALIAAAEAKSLDTMRVLIERGADVHALWSDQDRKTLYETGGQFSALQEAALSGDEWACILLLLRRASIEEPSTLYGSALHAAAHGGNLACIRVCLDAGAKINYEGGLLHTALQAAAGSNDPLEACQLLIEKGADVNLAGGTFHTPLHAAVVNNHVEVVKLLLDDGIDAKAQGGRHGTALQAAGFVNNEEITNILLDKSDINTNCGRFGNVLQAASMQGDLKYVQKLFDAGADVNARGGRYETALQAAAYGGNNPVVDLLLENKADPLIEGGFYGSALRTASCKGRLGIMDLLLETPTPRPLLNDALLGAVHNRQVEAAKKLIQRGADVMSSGKSFASVKEAMDMPAVGNDDDEAVFPNADDESDDDDNDEDDGGDDEDEDNNDEGDEGDDSDDDDDDDEDGDSDDESILGENDAEASKNKDQEIWRILTASNPKVSTLLSRQMGSRRMGTRRYPTRQFTRRQSMSQTRSRPQSWQRTPPNEPIDEAPKPPPPIPPHSQQNGYHSQYSTGAFASALRTQTQDFESKTQNPQQQRTSPHLDDLHFTQEPQAYQDSQNNQQPQQNSSYLDPDNAPKTFSSTSPTYHDASIPVETDGSNSNVYTPQPLRIQRKSVPPTSRPASGVSNNRPGSASPPPTGSENHYSSLAPPPPSNPPALPPRPPQEATQVGQAQPTTYTQMPQPPGDSSWGAAPSPSPPQQHQFSSARYSPNPPPQGSTGHSPPPRNTYSNAHGFYDGAGYPPPTTQPQYVQNIAYGSGSYPPQQQVQEQQQQQGSGGYKRYLPFGIGDRSGR